MSFEGGWGFAVMTAHELSQRELSVFFPLPPVYLCISQLPFTRFLTPFFFFLLACSQQPFLLGSFLKPDVAALQRRAG